MVAPQVIEDGSPDVACHPVPCPPGCPQLYSVSSTDFFSPISQDPYSQGRIAAANTLSDVYAAGVVQVQSMLMILALSDNMPEPARSVTTEHMIRGFQDACKEAGCIIVGGQTVTNPWPILGGVAMATVLEEQIVRTTNITAGDTLVLTKPLGTQVAANMWGWTLKPKFWAKVREYDVPYDEYTASVLAANESMMRLNMHAATLMHKYGAHGATDVTGFGMLGHARNLAFVNRKNEVDLEIDMLPVFKHTPKFERGITKDYQLSGGLSAETSGGLLLALPTDKAEAYIADLQAFHGDKWGWVVGRAVKGTGEARLVEGVKIVEV
mmetsp:Transcript_71327/g.170791  ORF Transcript_71327/g.170791 Transcript_71327/m.170791 type:complete len:324 (-) Transcript_71327:62-1033(-)